MKIPTSDTDITGEIFSLLYDLGVRADTTAFFHTAYAVRLVAEQPQKLLLVTKWLYPEVARHYHTNWKAVERNIRRLAKTVWEKEPNALAAFASRPLLGRPTTSQFIGILAKQLSKYNAA